MALLPVLIDPTGEGTGTELDINDGAPGRSGYVVEAPIDMPPPAVKSIYADSASTEGAIPVEDEPKYDNRQIGLKVHVYGSSASDLQNNLVALYGKIAKLHREGGTLSVTTAAEIECIFDLLPESNGPTTFDERYLSRNHVLVELTLTGRPFWRGQEIALGTFTEPTLPALVFTVSDVPGDVPALGRLVVTDLSGNDQWQVDVGVQSRYYDGSPTAALFYEAETLTPLDTADKTTATGASGTGNTVVRHQDLTLSWVAMLKSEIDTSNAALTHKGTFRVKVRVQNPNTSGNVRLRLEWGEGDYLRRTLNDPVTVEPRSGSWRWVDLGLVHITPESTRWEFRLLASASIDNKNVLVDCFALFPTTEGYAELSAVQQFETATLFSARDEFLGSTSIHNRDAPVGTSWIGAGDADDWTVTGGVAQRTAVSDAANPHTGGRYGYIDSPVLGAVIVQADFEFVGTVGTATVGLLARYVNTSNYLLVHWTTPGVGGALSANEQLYVSKVVAGTVTSGIGSRVGPGAGNIHTARWTLRVLVDTAGRVWVWSFPVGSAPGAPKIVTHDSVLATGGALDDGKVGIYDHYSPAVGGGTRKIAHFSASVPSLDAACYASQSLEVTHADARRENAGGTLWSSVSERRGRYLRIPPSGQEGRSTRLIVKGYRNDPNTMADPAIDDIQAQLFATPRGLVVPMA